MTRPRPALTPPLILRASSSHLYAGARLRLADSATADQLLHRREAGTAVILLFADGAEATAHLDRAPDGRLTLHVAAYTTARGTFISPRTWSIASVEQGSLRLTGFAAGPSS